MCTQTTEVSTSGLRRMESKITKARNSSDHIFLSTQYFIVLPNSVNLNKINSDFTLFYSNMRSEMLAAVAPD